MAFPSTFFIPILILGFIIFFKELLSETNNKSFFLTGFSFGFGHFLVGLHWIYFPITFDAKYENWAILITLFFIAFMSFFFAIQTRVVGSLVINNSQLKNNPLIKIFLISGIFFFFEILRSFVFGGFPWNLYSHIWTFNEQFLSVSSIIGIHGLSFISIYWIVLTSILYFKNKFYSLICLVLFPSFLFFISYEKEKYNPEKKIVVRIVQPNIPQQDKWKKKKVFENLKTLISLSNKDYKANKPDLVVWPESALTFFVNENENLLEYLKKNLNKEIILISGGLRRQTTNNKTRIYNSLYLIKDGAILNYYDKKKLVPFGEYMPLGKFIKFKKLTDGNLDFSKGSKSAFHEVMIENNKFNIQTNICYEGIFTMRDKIKQTPNLIINITNDAWFGDTSGPSQHIAAYQSRITEIGIPAVRVANSGISAFFNAEGKIINKMDLNSRGYIQHEFNLAVKSSIFDKFGISTTTIMIFLFSIFSIIIDWFLKKSRKKDFLV